MPKPFADDAKRDAFLATPRLAILMYNRELAAPIGVPVWFEWNGSTVEMFADATTPKVAGLERDPNASVLVTNAVGEAEAWVAFDGTIEIKSGGIELATRLAEHYWDLSVPGYRAVLDRWQKAPESSFCQLSLRPSRIRSGG
jgi:nitroimidazol reductase NimA-like FMN-containing flavoprotein (pyridoxamine 5'-phosphate oxidase superfamily)